MSTSFRDDSYRLPHYGRDGVQAIPDPLQGWQPSPLPKWPIPVEPENLIPGIPGVPGFPWWVDPWMPATPPPVAPQPLQPRRPSEPLVPQSLSGQTPLADAGGLLALLRETMLRNAEQVAGAADQFQARLKPRQSIAFGGNADPLHKGAPVDSRASSNGLLMGLVSGKPMRHYMIPIFDSE